MPAVEDAHVTSTDVAGVGVRGECVGRLGVSNRLFPLELRVRLQRPTNWRGHRRATGSVV